MTQTVHIGLGTIENVQRVLDKEGAESVFVVADPNAYQQSGAEAYLRSVLENTNSIFFDQFTPNPKLADVKKGLRLWDAHPCDMILGVGGGSAIDMAKLIGICAAHLGSRRELLTGEKPIHNQSPPLVAIPTTAGTGSEATHFAVVYIEGQKYSVAHPYVLPTYAIIDPDLTANLPASITAHTGLDALSQAVESLWSVNATEQSQAFAGEALVLVLRNLKAAVQNPTPSIRSDMCRAAHLSGKAINISKTTAPHAISYTLTSRFGVPHGLAVALTLGAVLMYNNEVAEGDCCHPQGIARVRRDLASINNLMEANTPADARKRIEDLLQSIGCPRRLREVGIKTEADLETIVQNVNTERLQNNPRALSQSDLRSLLRELL